MYLTQTHRLIDSLDSQKRSTRSRGIKLQSWVIESPKGNLLTPETFGSLRKCEVRFTENGITSDKSQLSNF